MEDWKKTMYGGKRILNESAGEPSLFNRMYGGMSSLAPVTETVPVEQVEEKDKPFYKVLSGLKLSQGHVIKANINGSDVELPNVAYVRLLEAEIQHLRQQLNLVMKKLDRVGSATDKNRADMHQMKNRMSDSQSRLDAVETDARRAINILDRTK